MKPDQTRAMTLLRVSVRGSVLADARQQVDAAMLQKAVEWQQSAIHACSTTANGKGIEKPLPKHWNEAFATIRRLIDATS